MNKTDMDRMVSEGNKQVARIVGDAFGGEWQAFGYLNSDETSRIYVLRSDDRPGTGLMSFSTVGLSDHPLPGDTEPPLGAEITACSNYERFADVLANAAFCVIDGGWLPQPGRIFPDLVSTHFEGTTVPHLFFVAPPYYWHELSVHRLAGKTVGWVMGIPISEAEKNYVGEHGDEALEDLFEKAQPNFIDLMRTSVV